jgi:5'(3')-deoxyribonucleotidase
MSLPDPKLEKSTPSTNDVGTQLKKFVIFFALSDVVADSKSIADKVSSEVLQQYGNRLDRIPEYYSLVSPMEGAVRKLHELNEHKLIDWHIVSSISWKSPHLVEEKRVWVERHFGEIAKDRMIFTKRKDLLHGEYLVYRHESKGVKEFPGKAMRFGEGQIPHWSHIVHHFGYMAEFGMGPDD